MKLNWNYFRWFRVFFNNKIDLWPSSLAIWSHVYRIWWNESRENCPWTYKDQRHRWKQFLCWLKIPYSIIIVKNKPYSVTLSQCSTLINRSMFQCFMYNIIIKIVNTLRKLSYSYNVTGIEILPGIDLFWLSVANSPLILICFGARLAFNWIFSNVFFW